jgi:Ca2+-transporting ATPase
VSVGLQIGVLSLPFLHQPFHTMPLSLADWVVCITVGSMVLWLRELLKLMQPRH